MTKTASMKRSIKDIVFLTAISKSNPNAKSSRSVIPADLLTKLKLAPGDKLCWQLGENNKITVWKKKKNERISSDRIIDLVPASEKTGFGSKMQLPDKHTTSTATAETQPGITGTSHI